MMIHDRTPQWYVLSIQKPTVSALKARSTAANTRSTRASSELRSCVPCGAHGRRVRGARIAGACAARHAPALTPATCAGARRGHRHGARHRARFGERHWDGRSSGRARRGGARRAKGQDRDERRQRGHGRPRRARRLRRRHQGARGGMRARAPPPPPASRVDESRRGRSQAHADVVVLGSRGMGSVKRSILSVVGLGSVSDCALCFPAAAPRACGCASLRGRSGRADVAHNATVPTIIVKTPPGTPRSSSAAQGSKSGGSA